MFSHVSMISHSLDTVEYPVLLSHLKSAGISGKTWQLIRNWYANPKSSVHVNNIISSPFNVNRGVSISPLFLLVMDPILLKLRTKSCVTQCEWALPWCPVPRMQMTSVPSRQILLIAESKSHSSTCSPPLAISL